MGQVNQQESRQLSAEDRRLPTALTMPMPHGPLLCVAEEQIPPLRLSESECQMQRAAAEPQVQAEEPPVLAEGPQAELAELPVPLQEPVPEPLPLQEPLQVPALKLQELQSAFRSAFRRACSDA